MFKYVVILAAGKGERLKPLTTYVPKPLIYKNEIMLMTRALKAVASINNIYVTVHYKSKMIMTEYADMVDGFINTLGNDNAWFVHNTIIREINEPIVVIPADIEFEINLHKLYEEYLDRKIDHMLVPVYPQAMPKYFCEGDMIYGENGLVQDISRNKQTKNEIGLCSGIQIINPKKFPKNHSFIDAWKVLSHVEQLHYSYITPKFWSCVDRIDQL